MYYEIGVPTEPEVLNYLGVLPKDVGLPSVSIQSPELGSITVHPMSLRGMHGGDLASMRKMRISHSARIMLQEQYLTPAIQFHEEQGRTWLDHAARQHVKNRPEAFKGKTDLQSFASMQSKAKALLASRQASMVHRFEGPGPSGGVKVEGEDAAMDEMKASAEGEASDPEAAYSSPKPKRQRASGAVVQQPTAAMGLLGGDKPDAHVRMRPKASGRGRGGRGRAAARGQPARALSADVEEAGAEEDTSVMNAPDLAALLKRDPDMYEVAKAHEALAGKPSVCFFNMDVLRFLEGEKLGQCLNGASVLQTSW